MAYTVGFCDECRVVVFEPILVLRFDVYFFDCPVCKKETEFNPVAELHRE